MRFPKYSLWDENSGDNGGSSGSSQNIDVDSLKSEIDRLKSHNAKILDEKKKIQSQLKKFDGLDADKIKDMMKTIESSEETKLIAEGKFTEVLSKHTERMRLDFDQKLNDLAQDKEESDKQRKKYQDQYNNLIVNTEIRRQAEKAGVIPAAIDDVIARSNGMFSLDENGNIESRDSEGNLRTVKKKAMDPALFIEQLKESAPHFWPASKGVGATGGSGNGVDTSKNPFMPGKGYNLTEQGRLMNQDPEKAARLKAIADSAS